MCTSSFASQSGAAISFKGRRKFDSSSCSKSQHTTHHELNKRNRTTPHHSNTDNDNTTTYQRNQQNLAASSHENASQHGHVHHQLTTPINNNNHNRAPAPAFAPPPMQNTSHATAHHHDHTPLDLPPPLSTTNANTTQHHNIPQNNLQPTTRARPRPTATTYHGPDHAHNHTNQLEHDHEYEPTTDTPPHAHKKQRTLNNNPHTNTQHTPNTTQTTDDALNHQLRYPDNMTLTQLLGTDPTRHNHGHSTTTMPTMPLNDSLSSEALAAPLDTTMTCHADGQPRILPQPLLRHQPRPQPQLQTQPTNHPPQQGALPTDILWTQQPEQFTDILRTQQQLAHGNESPVFPNEMTLTQLLQTNSTYPNEMTLTQLLQTEPTHRNHATTTTTATTNNSPPPTHNDNATTQPHATSKRQRTERTPPNKTRKRRPTTTTTNTDDNHDNNHTPSTGSTNAPIRHTNNQHSPYTGDHRSAFWNSQGLYATDPNKQERKWGYTAHLCNNRDIVGVAETHSNEGKAMGGHPPHDVTTFWSHGTNAVGGVGILINKTFLRNFNAPTESSWQHIIEGRVARLRLEGPKGNLDIYVLYLQSGNDSGDRQSRIKAANTIARHMAPAAERLSLVMGDFNFVTRSCDRHSKHNLTDNQELDKREAKHFDDVLWSPYHLHELHQPHETHENGRAYSRLDRVYSNHHTLDQLDRVYTCYTLPRNHTLSDHNAICFGRATPKHHKQAQSRIPESTTQHPDFTRRVITETHHLLANDTATDTPFRRLILTKQAMWTTHEGIVKDNNPTDEHNAPLGHNTEVGWILSYIRAAEKQNTARMLVCAKACPAISRHTNPRDPNTREKPGLQSLKDYALSVARQTLAQEMAELHHEAQPEGDDNTTTQPTSTNTQEETNLHRERKRSNIVTKLKRMLPGSTNHIGAIGQEDGSITNEPEAMAAALAKHWSKVFQKKPIDTALLSDWFRSLRNARLQETNNHHENHTPEHDLLPGHKPLPRQALPTDKASWAPTRKDMKKAMRLAGNSSPGPDGIPFSAWRALGETGLNTLHDVACALRRDGATTLLEDAYFDQPGEERHQYNVSNLVCLPKSPSVDDHGAMGTYYQPKDTRPLAIVNCDNRLVASAARWRWEEHVGKFVKDRQQGFLTQRSILRNLLDVENAMILCSCKDVDGAALFLDFTAAFPSIDQDFHHADPQ